MGKQQQQEEAEDREMYEKVRAVVAGSAVVVITLRDCCMCHVAKQLLFSLGVGPTVIELQSRYDPAHIQSVLHHLCPGRGGGNDAAPQPPTPLHFPAIFVGGTFLGGIEALMACHINGSLVPLLKQAGALWL